MIRALQFSQADTCNSNHEERVSVKAMQQTVGEVAKRSRHQTDEESMLQEQTFPLLNMQFSHLLLTLNMVGYYISTRLMKTVSKAFSSEEIGKELQEWRGKVIFDIEKALTFDQWQGDAEANRATAMAKQLGEGTNEDTFAAMIDHGYPLNVGVPIISFRDSVHKQQNGTVLTAACFMGGKRAVQMLLCAKANPNLQTVDGSTALMIACLHNKPEIAPEIARLLLEHGNTDPNIQRKDGYTALMIACLHNKPEIARLLLEDGNAEDGNADPNIQQKDGSTALMTACMDNKPEIAGLLLEDGNADPNIQRKDGYTALMIACNRNNLKIARLLLDRPNTDPNIQQEGGYTALMIACHWENWKIATWLLEHPNTDPNLQTVDGSTALMIVCRRNNVEVTRLLLDKHADVLLTTECNWHGRSRNVMELTLDKIRHAILGRDVVLPNTVRLAYILISVHQEKNPDLSDNLKESNISLINALNEIYEVAQAKGYVPHKWASKLCGTLGIAPMY